MTCYGCNDTGHLYQAFRGRRRLQKKTPIPTPTSWVDIGARRTEDTLHDLEDEKGKARCSGQPEPANRN